MLLLDLFIGAIIFLILRWLFLKLLDQYHKYTIEHNKKNEVLAPPLLTSLDELEKKAESNLVEREEIRGVTEQTQEQITNIKSKIK